MIRTSCLVLGALSFCALAARGDVVEPPAHGEHAAAHGEQAEHGESFTKETWPVEFTHRPLTLAAGLFELGVPVEINLSKDEVGKPVSIPLTAYYGLTNQLTVGVTHERGLCLTGTSNGCDKVYDDVGFEARFLVAPRGAFQAALIAGYLIHGISDFVSAVELGADLRYDILPIAIRLRPTLGIGVTKRELFNKELLQVPLTIEFQATHQLVLEAFTGLNLVVDPPAPIAAGDTLTVPVGFAGIYTPSRTLDVGAEFRFENLLGKDGSADVRALRLFATIRL